MIDVDPERYWRYTGPVATALVGVSAIVVLTTFGAGEPLLPAGAGFLGVPLLFVIHLGTVHSVILATRRSGDRKALMRMVFRIPYYPAFVLFWLAGMSGLLAVGGVPKERDGRYYLDNHGIETEVTKGEFEDAVRSDVRAAAAVTGAFAVVAVAVRRNYRTVWST